MASLSEPSKREREREREEGGGRKREKFYENETPSL
jgi:hypothetical protein